MVKDFRQGIVGHVNNDKYSVLIQKLVDLHGKDLKVCRGPGVPSGCCCLAAMLNRAGTGS